MPLSVFRCFGDFSCQLTGTLAHEYHGTIFLLLFVKWLVFMLTPQTYNYHFLRKPRIMRKSVRRMTLRLEMAKFSLSGEV